MDKTQGLSPPPPLAETPLVRALFHLQDLPGPVGRSFGRKLRRRMKRPTAAAFAAMLRRLGPDDVCLDLGANVGKVTRDLAATGARVHAVEPDPDNFAALSAAVGHLPNVTLHHAAVGAQSGRLRMFRSSSEAFMPGNRTSQGVTGRFRPGQSDHGTAFEVEMVALDDLIARAGGRVALVKMDIEGGEFDILAAMEAGRLRVDCAAMFIETHERYYPEVWPQLRAMRHARRGRTDPLISLYWG